MSNRIRRALAAAGLLAALSFGSAFAQTSDSKNAASKMIDQQMMDRMDKMSTGEKAAMFDKMPMEKKMSTMHNTSMKDNAKKKRERLKIDLQAFAGM